MEVHHHPHIHRKKFKEYILEFTMIFLAVTLGFFAESLREHIKDRSKEKEYMKEIVNNLQYDTIRCNRNFETNIQMTMGLDSLRAALREAMNGHIAENDLYYFTLAYLGRFGQVAFNTTAINELKNSGSVRMIENVKLLNEISDYYERKIFAAQYYMPSHEHLNELRKAQNEIFSLVDFDDYVDVYDHIDEQNFETNYKYTSIKGHSPSFHLLKTRATDLESFYTLVSQAEIEIKVYNFWIMACKNAAEKLINDVSKEYHFENKTGNE